MISDKINYPAFYMAKRDKYTKSRYNGIIKSGEVFQYAPLSEELPQAHPRLS